MLHLLRASRDGHGFCRRRHLSLFCPVGLSNLANESKIFNRLLIEVDGASTARNGVRAVRGTPKPCAGKGWLAMPRMRFHEKPAGPSYETQEPAWRRRNAQSDYAL